MSGFEEVIKMVYGFYRKKRNNADLPCPEEETLVCFCEGKLSKDESKRVQEHLAACGRCAEAVSLFCQKIEEQREVPGFLIEKAKSLVKEMPFSSIFEVVLALKEKGLQILRTTGDVIVGNEIMPYPVYRRRKMPESTEEIDLIKELENIKITINIQKKDKDKVRLSLVLADKVSLQPLSDLRLALLKDGSELESYEAASGSAAFDNVGFGYYDIEILQRDKKLSVIRLEIK
ncbi:MAG: zf-HC2 domain-containing protein [Candidatus Omnitrophota bacterium]